MKRRIDLFLRRLRNRRYKRHSKNQISESDDNIKMNRQGAGIIFAALNLASQGEINVTSRELKKGNLNVRIDLCNAEGRILASGNGSYPLPGIPEPENRTAEDEAAVKDAYKYAYIGAVMCAIIQGEHLHGTTISSGQPWLEESRKQGDFEKTGRIINLRGLLEKACTQEEVRELQAIWKRRYELLNKSEKNRLKGVYDYGHQIMREHQSSLEPGEVKKT